MTFGLVKNNEHEKKSKLNLPPNHKNDILFNQLEHPILKEIIRDAIADNLSLQKYLSANGNSKKSIQDSLDMIVTDSKFNDASVCRALDLKIPSLMKKSNPVDVVYKDVAKFGTQNPVIGSLLSQIEPGKLTDKKVDEYLNKIPFVKDLEIAAKLKQLKDFY